MAFPDVRSRLEDILDGAEWIDRLTAGRSLAEYGADRITRDAVERNLERISEASRHIPGDLKAGYPLTDWRAIARVGNILRHGYQSVDDAKIWAIVTLDLPALRTVVEAMLRSLGGDDAGADADP